MKIIAVRIGDKYGPQYEEYLKKKLPQHEFIWIHEPFDPRVQMQWNKMAGMNLNIDEPICVMDIDMLLVGDYHKVFDYPIEHGQFLSMPGWWRDTKKSNYVINGGFFKYYPKECQYIYDEFMKNPEYWQSYYIKNGTTSGPINGEQYFVEDHAKQRLDVITLPDAWFTRWVVNEDINYGKNMNIWKVNITRKYKKLTGNEYVYLGGEFHPDIKVVHFTHRNNKPHMWESYKDYV